MLISENRWRAQRYGFDEGMIDLGKGTIVPYAELLDELIDLTGEDAEYFDCVAEVEHGREILKRGTSAHRQLALYNKLREDGVDKLEALKAVVDQLMEETIEGL